MSAGWKGVNKRAPCPACEGTDRCSTRTDDEGAEWLHCFRTKQPPSGWRFVKDSPTDARGALFVRDDGNGSSGPRREPRARSVPPRAKLDLAAEHATMRSQLTPAERAGLARALGLPMFAVEALEPGFANADDLKLLRVGFPGDGPSPIEAWVFPERDGKRELVGFSFRAKDGRKGAPSGDVGSRRGLIVPTTFERHVGTVLVAEGASDVAALVAVGLCAVGRPSNASGSSDLADLLRGRTADVLVLGENDAREKDGRTLWPGRDGAVKVASDLAASWHKSTRWALPPDGAKDVRAWLQARVASGLDLGDRGAREAAGRELLAAMERAAEVIEPPPEPTRLDWRPFLTDALPEPLRSFVREAARARGVDEAMVAVPLLGILAGAIGNARRLRVAPEFVVPSVLWTCVLAESGDRKTPAIRAASATLDAIDSELRKQTENDLADYNEALRRWSDVKDKSTRGERPRPPRQRQAKVDDATSEALLGALLDNPRGLTHASDELAGFLLGCDQYKPRGKGNDAQRYLRMYDASDVTLDRVKGGTDGLRLSLSIKRAALSIGGAAQPAIFTRAIGRDGRENGMLARMLVAMPPVVEVTWASLQGAEVPSAALLDAVLRKLALLDMPNDEPLDLTLSASGAARWAAFFDDFQAVKRHAASPTLRAHFSKLEGACARIALGFHMVRAIAGDVTLEALEQVDGASIDAAARLVGWFAHEAERVYTLLDEPPQARAERKLVEWIAERGGEATPSDLCASAPRPIRPKSVPDAERMLRELERAGHGALTYDAPPRTGGHSRHVFRLRREDAGSSRGTSEPENEASASASTNAKAEIEAQAQCDVSEPAPVEANALDKLTPDQRERWTESAAKYEYEAGMSREDAERQAWRDIELEPPQGT